MKKYFYFINNIIFYSIFFMQLPVSLSECNRNTPILVNNNYCELKYCTKEEYKSGNCIIDNSIVKTQWLNNIILFDFDKFRYGNFALNSKGDLIYECSTEEANGKRVFYWLKKNGSFYFQDENGKKIPTKMIILQNNGEFPIRYESSFIPVFVNSNECFLSISVDIGAAELYDFENNKFSFFSSLDFTNYKIYTLISSLIEDDYGSSKKYLHTFIGQTKSDQTFQNFYFISQKYSFTKNTIGLNDGYTIQQKINQWTKNARVISSFKLDSNIIIIFYLNENNFLIKAYQNNDNDNNNFQELGTFTISDTNFIFDENLFYKGIYMKDNLGIFAFYYKIDQYYPKIKVIEISNNGYSFTEQFNFELYSPGEFSTETLLNDIIKMNDNRFCYISSSRDRQSLYINLFDFFNNNKIIKERAYKIELYKLYKYMIYREITSIMYNNYLTLSLSACATDTCDYTSNYFSFIIIFGYINGTSTNINISNFLSDFSEFNEKNLIDEILVNITIDNNIFGYEYLSDKIKLISVP